MNKRHAAAALGLALLAPAACGGGRPAASATAASQEAPVKPMSVEQLAQAAGAQVTSVSAFAQHGWPAARVALAWGVVTDSGAAQAWLLVQPQGAPAKALRLPAGRELSLLAWLDLQGAPAVLNLLQPPADPTTVQAAAAATPNQPAVLLRVQNLLDSGERRSTLMLVALGLSPAALWREVEASTPPSGHAYRSHQLALKPAAGGTHLALELGQTSLPGSGAQPQMPGPPLALRFNFDGKLYQRARP